jgi:uncharacterized protein YpiB (UPF0302 family)
MEIKHLLKELIKVEDEKMKKYVLFMLLKFSHLVNEITEDNQYLPLLLIKDKRITLVYKEDSEDREYIFTDYEDMLIVLQKLFKENKSLYFYCEDEIEVFNYEDLLRKIDESLLENNEEEFYYYSNKLLKRGDSY